MHGNKLCLLSLGAAACLLSGCASILSDHRHGVQGNPEQYRLVLAEKLKNKYNNLPNYAGQVSRVELVVPRSPKVSSDGQEVQVEYDQLVYDKWGQRMPLLESEYYIVTFGPGQPKIVRTEPSLTVGLNIQGGYSESAPVVGGRLGALRTAEPAVPAMPAAPIVPAPASSDQTTLRPSEILTLEDGDFAPRPEAASAVSAPLVAPVNEQLPPVVMPAALAGREARPVAASEPLEFAPELPGLVESMKPPRAVTGRLPRAEVRNLPLPEPATP